MIKKKTISKAIILVLLFSLIQAYNRPMAANAVSTYKLSQTGTYTLTTTITMRSNYNTKFNMTYNIGSISKSPYQKEVSIKIYGNGAALKKYSDGRRKLVVNSTTKNGQAVYKVVRVIKNSAITYNKQLLSSASSNYSGFKDYKKYTSAESKIESNSNAIKNKAKTLFKGVKSPYLKAQKAFAFVNSYMTYGYAYENQGALSALTHKTGVCEDYADLFVALLRASGVPARVVAGYWAQSKDFSNNTINSAESCAHAWPEFYLPKYGWITAEPTFTYIYNGKKTVNYNFFAKLASADHLLTGYNTTGDDAVAHVKWTSYSYISCNMNTTIVKK